MRGKLNAHGDMSFPDFKITTRLANYDRLNSIDSISTTKNTSNLLHRNTNDGISNSNLYQNAEPRYISCSQHFLLPIKFQMSPQILCNNVKFPENEIITGLEQYGNIQCNLKLTSKRSHQSDNKLRSISNVMKPVRDQKATIQSTDIRTVIQTSHLQHLQRQETDQQLLTVIPPTRPLTTSTNMTLSSSSSSSSSPSWQAISTPGTPVANYFSRFSTPTFPFSIHDIFKYSTDNIKKETAEPLTTTITTSQLQNPTRVIDGSRTVELDKKMVTKIPGKGKTPRSKPVNIIITTALDGTRLFTCPLCLIAYPHQPLIEQHLTSHGFERKFYCDICGAGLKRKDHLTRHKQSHNPERPHACTVCSKTFKRKEQLAMHFVIHSGEKRHVCPECGKGFYRKDHLRKHTKSHVARRVKSELAHNIPLLAQSGIINDS